MFFSLRRLTRGAVAALALGALAPAWAGAQATGTIRGRVTESGSGRGIAEAQVTISGTGLGAVTNSGGDYTIANAPAGQLTLIARRIGYTRRTQPATVQAGAEIRADFELTLAPTQLEAIVTTGTAGAVEKRTIGNAVSQIDVSSVTKNATVLNVSEVLQARTPGVSVSAGSGTPGTASEITIRGYGSFTTNRPVVFIDGVRMNTDAIGNFNPSGAGTGGFTGQTTSALDLINPDDIESIEILKGPAAATLYGADAAGGVIQIITKKGARGQQPLRWTGRFEMGRNEWGVGTLENWTQCTAAMIAARDAANAPLWPGCQGQTANAILVDNPLRRDSLALRTGGLLRYALGVRGGGDRFSYYMSGNVDSDEGVFFNSINRRRSLRANFSANPNEKADFTVNLGYIRSKLRLPVGDEAANGLLLSAARGRPGQARIRKSLDGWSTIEPALANRYNNQTTTDRLIVGTTVNYAPFKWMRNRATVGMDFSSALAQILSLPGDPDTPTGLNAERVPRIYNYTLDYAGSAVANLRSNLEATTSIGTQVTSNRTEILNATGSQLPTREVTLINAALTTSGSESYSEFNSVGIWGQEQLGWNNRLFLVVAVRGDDHSSFGKDFNAIIYPKASVSYVISEEPRLKGFFDMLRADNFRLRGAWGQAGRAPQPYSASQTYTSDRVISGTSVLGAIRSSAFGNPNLKPEKGEEIELGFDGAFLRNRTGIDVTYYNKVMKDLLVPLALPPSTGFGGSMLQNIGKTRNYGVELGLTATPVDLKNVLWDARLNFSVNRNKLLMLDTLRTEEVLSGLSYSPNMQRNRVGYPLGSYFLRYPIRDASGKPVLVGGVPTYDTAFKYAGPAAPTRLASFSSTVTLFKSWRLYGLLDYQGGYKLFNYKEYNRCAVNFNCPKIYDPNLSVEDRALLSTTGTTAIWTQTNYVEKGDFTKLRDLSLTYTIPARWAQRAGADAVNLTVAGHNLAIFTSYSGLDPEVNGYSNNSLRGNSGFGRVDAYPMPQTRRFSFAINATY
jgi:TonB-linked SusC/RagA family outer membrane protein